MGSPEDRKRIRSGVQPGQRRDDVQVRLPDDRVFDAPRDTPLVEFFRAAFPNGDDPLVAAIVDGELRELGRPVDTDVDAEPVFLSSSDGIRIYSRGLSFLLVVVVSELYPGVRVCIEYSVPHGGFFCRVEGRKPFTSRELSRVRVRMEELVAEDLPILRERYALDEATEMFALAARRARPGFSRPAWRIIFICTR